MGTTEHPNVTAYRRTADAFRAGDVAALRSLIDEDVLGTCLADMQWQERSAVSTTSSPGSVDSARWASHSGSTMCSGTTSTSARSATWVPGGQDWTSSSG
jgi:hypothetical protein